MKMTKSNALTSSVIRKLAKFQKKIYWIKIFSLLKITLNLTVTFWRQSISNFHWKLIQIPSAKKVLLSEWINGASDIHNNLFSYCTQVNVIMGDSINFKIHFVNVPLISSWSFATKIPSHYNLLPTTRKIHQRD